MSKGFDGSQLIFVFSLQIARRVWKKRGTSTSLGHEWWTKKKLSPTLFRINSFQHLIPCFGVEVPVGRLGVTWWSLIIKYIIQSVGMSLDKKGTQQNLLVWWRIFNSRETSFKTSIRTFLGTSLRPPFLPTCFHLSFDPRSLRNGFRRRFVAWNKKNTSVWGGQRRGSFDNYVGVVSMIFYFHPEPWGNDFNLTNSYFSDGWFNHQLQ